MCVCLYMYLVCILTYTLFEKRFLSQAKRESKKCLSPLIR